MARRSRRGRSDDRGADRLEPADRAGETADAAQPVPDGAEPASVRRRPLDESEAVAPGVGEDSDPGAAADAARQAALPRLDLGSLRVPVLPETEIRVELNEQGQPVAASVLHAGSAVQILAFAAPRGEGIWDEIREQIAESVRSSGGEAHDVDGPFGVELRTRVRGDASQGQPAEQQLRFVGFDGPRWFVRALFSGAAATNPVRAAVLETVVTSVVVVRGSEPMAPREALPLRLPQDVAGGGEGPAAAAGEQGPPRLQMPERGPEITETR